MAIKPLVSVLIPSFNAERWIGLAIHSVLTQDYPSIEVIVVDDGSLDRTVEIARRFEGRTVKVITQPNGGAPVARNTALAHAQGDYIQWLDADDMLGPQKISMQMKRSERVADDRTLLSCPFFTFYFRTEAAKLFSSLLYQDLTPSDYFFVKFNYDTFLQPATWLVSRHLTEAAGPWWELRSADDDGEYFCRVVAASNAVSFVPSARTFWRVGNSGSVSWAWRRSGRDLEALFQSTARCVEHYRKFEVTPRSQAACLTFLHRRLTLFYPESPELVDKTRKLIIELGGTMMLPILSPKYQYIQKMFGTGIAKKSQFFIRSARTRFERSWDLFRAKTSEAHDRIRTLTMTGE